MAVVKTVKLSEFSGFGFREDAAEAAELDLRVQQTLGKSIILSILLPCNPKEFSESV